MLPAAPIAVDVNALAFAPPTDPLTKPADPRVIMRDIPNYSYMGTWERDGVRGALDAHKVGQFSTASMLADDLYSDDRVQATLGSRTGALFGQPTTFERAEADADGECLAAWKEQYECMSADGVFNEVKRQAIMIGLCVCEVLWDTSVTPWRQYLKPWSARFLYYRWDIRRLVAMTMNGPVIIEPGDGKWFVHAPYGLYRGWLHATIRAIADLWLIKKLAWRDWARFNERHGLPIILAYVPAAGDAKQKEQFINGMATMGQEAVVGLPQNVDETGYDVKLLEARDRAYDTFGKTIEAVDRSIILAIKSQNLTTEVTEGSFAAARQHGGTEQVTLEFDAKTWSSDVDEQLARPFALFNFGDTEMAPGTTYDVEPIEDDKAKAEVASTFSDAVASLATAGVKLTPEGVVALAESMSVPITRAMIQELTASSSTFRIPFTPTDLASFVTVNEARESQGLDPLEGPDGLLTVAQYQAKNATVIGAANAAVTSGAPDGQAPTG
jgi:phage gp29-like protein